MRYIGAVLCVILLFSCQDIDKVEKPKDLIAENKMAEILTDLSLLNSAKNYNRKILEETGLKPDEYLYAKHNIDSAQLSQSTRYYALNQNNLESIYKKVKANLEKLQKDIEIIKEREDKEKDTLGNEVEVDSLVEDSVIRVDTSGDSFIPKPPDPNQDLSIN